MKRGTVVAVLVAGAMWLWAGAAPRVTRAALAALEKSFDQRIERFDINDPFYLLGATRGVYLEGFGAVFTAELNLVPGTPITPFRPSVSKEQIAQLRQKKLSRLPALRKNMVDMMVSSATSLRNVPPEEQIVLGVSLFHYSWEDTAGLPSQIVMQSRRKSLIDFEAGQLDRAALDAAIRVQEF